MRLVLPLFLLALPLLAVAQDDGPRLPKAEERARFHPFAVKGMSAEARRASYETRLAREAASPYGGMRWRNIGPEIQGGRVVDIEAPLDQPDQVLVATATGGLWRTEDDGISWKSLFEDRSSFGIGAFAVSRDGKTIYLGTGEANSQRTSYAGTGVYKSTDAGATWTHVGLAESHHIGRVIMHPSDPNTVYVAALGHLYSQNPERGVYKTTDGGKSWRQVLKGDLYTGAIDIVIDPKNPRLLIAALWDRDRRAWNFRESGPGSAVFRSTNAGETWSKIDALPSGEAAGRVGLALATEKPNVVYAFFDNQNFDPDWEFLDERVPGGRLTARRFLRLDEKAFAALERRVLEPFWRANAPTGYRLEDAQEEVKAGKKTMAEVRKRLTERNPNLFVPDIVGSEMYRSDDSGKTWRRTERGRLGELGGYYWGKVAVNPKDPDDVMALGVPLVRSTDGGKTWSRVAQGVHVDFHAIWHDPRTPNKVWIGCDGGVYLSYDGGKTARHLNNIPLAQATTLALDNKTPYNVYIGLQDNGTMKGPSTYRPGVNSLNDWTTIFGGDGSHIALDPRNGGDVVYFAFQFGMHFARDQRTGETWSTRAEPGANEPPARYNWISPFIVSAHHPDIVYIGNQRVYRSFNQGRKWEPISPDLTKNRPNGDVPYSTLKDLSESPLRFGLIYAGADDGTVQVTQDGGVTWQNISTPEKDKWVSRVVASRHAVGTVYVSQSGYREDDFRAFLWKSTDFGRTWTSIVGDLPAETINVVREDPKSPQTLYVGTDMGVFITFDGGKQWETLHGGMPNLPIHDLAIQERERDLVAATHARGVYILSLKPMEDLTPEVRAKRLHLFPLANMVRSATWGYEGRSRWDSSPPRSPKLRVRAWTQEGGDATLRILGKDGKAVREAKVTLERGWNEVEIDLLLDPGKSRLEPLRERPQDPLADPYASDRAQFLPAGDYRVEIEQGGQKVATDWKLSA